MTVEPMATRNSDVDNRPHVLLLLRSLDRGGAERQAVTLAKVLKSHGWPISVACFYAGGPLQRDLDQAGVPVIDLAKRNRWDVFGFSLRLLRVLRLERPDVLYSWLPVPNLLAALAKRACPRMNVVWGVRSSNVDLNHYDVMTRLCYWLERRFVHGADLVIANSESGAKLRIESGFPAETMRVIPNGIDTGKFRFDPEGRMSMRRDWRIPIDAMVVGLVGRLDPMKDHPTFLAAAAKLAARDARWHFVCVGGGPPEYKESLVKLAADLGLTDRLTWAGPRDDMAAVYSALDITSSSSSFGEGFANVIAEAMACGQPCVVTDVGDSAAIVGNLGIAVPSRDPDALADEIGRMCRRLYEQDGKVACAASCRERIVTEFSVQRLAHRTEQALLAVSESGTMGGASISP